MVTNVPLWGVSAEDSSLDSTKYHLGGEVNLLTVHVLWIYLDSTYKLFDLFFCL